MDARFCHMIQIVTYTAQLRAIDSDISSYGPMEFIELYRSLFFSTNLATSFTCRSIC